MLRRPKQLKTEVVAPEEEEENTVLVSNNIIRYIWALAQCQLITIH